MGITMGACKTKTIHADLGISTNILTYSGIIGHMQELFRHIQELFRSIQA